MLPSETSSAPGAAQRPCCLNLPVLSLNAAPEMLMPTHYPWTQFGTTCLSTRTVVGMTWP